MKTKTLLFLLAIFFVGFSNAQYTTGTVNLGSSGMTLNISTTATQVTLVLTGPSTNYLGVNFTNDGMDSGTDGFIYNSSSSTDYTFQGKGSTPNADTSQDWTIVSNNVSGSTRTITATRSLAGGSGDYMFTNTAGSMTFAWARGNSTSLAYHATRGYTTLTKTSNLGIDDVKANQQFLLTQNPVKEHFVFQNVKNIEVFKVYDVNGRMIYQPQNITEITDASFLKKGVYFMEIKTKEGEIFYEKIIKE